MKIRDLVKHWESSSATRMAARAYHVRLPLHDAARIAVLAEMYPGRSETEFITELLSAALDELEGSLPYVAGSRAVSEDEYGDPVYEDVGPTSRFIELTRKHARLIEKEDGPQAD